MNLKKIIPFENYTLTSNLPADEVRKRITENTEPGKFFRSPFRNKTFTKPYEGQIFRDQFAISRIINYQNAFVPIISGRISTIAGGTEINIQIRLSSTTSAFMIFWQVIVGLVCILTIFTVMKQFHKIVDSGPTSMVLIMPFAMFFGGLFLMSTGFKNESLKAKEFLAILLEGQEKM